MLLSKTWENIIFSGSKMDSFHILCISVFRFRKMLLLYVMYRFFNRFRKMLFEAETIDSIFYVSHHYHIYIHICTGMYIIIYDICRYVEVHVEASVSVLIQTSRLQRNFFSGQVSRVQMATSWLCDLHQPNEQCESRAHSNPPNHSQNQECCPDMGLIREGIIVPSGSQRVSQCLTELDWIWLCNSSPVTITRACAS